MGVDLEYGVNRGPLLVIGLDAREIHVDQIDRGDRAGGERRLRLRDRGVHEPEWHARRRRLDWRGGAPDERYDHNRREQRSPPEIADTNHASGDKRVRMHRTLLYAELVAEANRRRPDVGHASRAALCGPYDREVYHRMQRECDELRERDDEAR